MSSKAFIEVFFLLEIMIQISVKSEELRNETSREIISARYPPRNGVISKVNSFEPSSVWGCDKYSDAVEVVTKRAIALAKEVTTCLQSLGVENHLEESTRIKSDRVSTRERKLNVLREGVNFYRDFSTLFEALWYDFKNAFYLLGEQISYRLELHISGLPLSEV